MDPTGLSDEGGVLVLSDEQQVVATWADLLEGDHRIVSETSAGAALERLRMDEGIAAILCDQQMLHMSGDEFFFAAKVLTAATRILITDRDDFEGVVRAVNEGQIHACLVKPLNPDALKKTVRRAVDHYKRNQAIMHECARFGDLMRSTSDGIFFKDAKGRYVRLNSAEAEILNLLKPEDALGLRLCDLLPADLARAWSEEERAVLEGGMRGRCSIRSILTEQGDRKWYAVNMAAVRASGQGVAGGLVGISRDITEERNAQRMKNESVSTISHELRTPLTSIQGSLALLRTGVAGELSQDIGNLIEIGYQNCRRLLKLINEILDLEKLESGSIRIEREPVDVPALLREAVAANAGYGQPENKSIHIREPIPSVFVEGDKDRLLQVLANLISNAFKFSTAGGTIRLRAAIRGDYLRVSVTDCGVGIPKEFRSRIFQRYSQADAAHAKKNSGSGLGLNISRSIIELHGGRIDFRSRVDKGTTFYFELPLYCAGGSVND